jgi:hypothetical protein
VFEIFFLRELHVVYMDLRAYLLMTIDVLFSLTFNPEDEGNMFF